MSVEENAAGEGGRKGGRRGGRITGRAAREERKEKEKKQEGKWRGGQEVGWAQVEKKKKKLEGLGGLG